MTSSVQGDGALPRITVETFDTCLWVDSLPMGEGSTCSLLTSREPCVYKTSHTYKRFHLTSLIHLLVFAEH